MSSFPTQDADIVAMLDALQTATTALTESCPLFADTLQELLDQSTTNAGAAVMALPAEAPNVLVDGVYVGPDREWYVFRDDRGHLQFGHSDDGGVTYNNMSVIARCTCGAMLTSLPMPP